MSHVCHGMAAALRELDTRRESWSLARADVEEWAGAHGYVTSCVEHLHGLVTVKVVGTDYEVLGDASEDAAWVDLAALIDAREAQSGRETPDAR